MTDADYIKDRLENQISWYDRRSARSKTWFYALSLGQAIVASAIAIVSAVSEKPDRSVLVVLATMGGITAVTTSVLGLLKFQEDWLSYRSTCEALKKEKFFFLACAGPYTDETKRFETLVERVESLISREHTSWAQMTANAKLEKKDGA